MPFKKENFLKKVSVGYLTGFLSFALIFVISVLGGGFKIQSIWTSNNLPILLLFCIGFLIQGTTEEIICRGYIQGRISQKMRIYWGIIISTIFFILAHIGNNGISLAGVGGLLIFSVLTSLLRFYTGDLWLCSTLHAAWNFAEGPIFGTAVSGNSGMGLVFKSTSIPNHPLLTGNQFGIEASLISILIQIMLIIVIIYLGQKHSRLSIFKKAA
ncbi:CPBP family intramembrane glutamic endopeptidase [Lactobacillus helveticus]|uniref:CPBP family intramembrane glutamic endopeptidase n=1 Tax=Lactobacillus helveticus TaxID=1587 RepID=UPI0015650588|nr:CPBP family intramembrane glutamic endopeptidase [Lactobacillus helveticus]NRO04346.1 hypothetical protein [Lactobacillus helveticus]